MDYNFDKYLNLNHGLELYPDINTGDRQNENGILFLVTLILLAGEQDYSLQFHQVINGLEVKPGLYDRGRLDKYYTEPKRLLSHDNISAIAAGSYYLGTKHARDIAVYGLKHFFSYNNRQKGFRPPINPGNYSIWLALGKTAPLLQALFLPFYLINFFITNNKSPGQTSGKILNFVELYPLRKHFFWGKIYKLYMNKMKKMYGENPIKALTDIYYKDENHPVRLAANNFKE